MDCEQGVTSNISMRVLDSPDALLDLKPDWQRLADSDPNSTPFNSFEWLSMWWKHYAKPDYQLHVLVYNCENQTIAIAPLYVARVKQLRLIATTELRWLGTGGDTSPDYLNFLSEPDHRNVITKLFIEHLLSLKSIDRIHLTDNLCPSDLYTALSAALHAEPGTVTSRISNSIRYAELPTRFEDYRMALTRKRRKQINHRRNRLDQAGNWQLVVRDSRESALEALTRLEALHRDRWRSKGEPGGFASPAYVGFHQGVVGAIADTGNVWMVTLELNNEIIGVLYLYAWRDSLLFFQSGFSPEHESLSPGHVMFTFVIAEAIERGFKYIDMLKGDYKYKNTYAKLERNTQDILFVRGRVMGVLEIVKKEIKSLTQ